VAIAQRARSSMNPDKQLHDAPVADQVRSECALRGMATSESD